MPPTYLRFTPAEYRVIARACRTLPIADDAFPAFQQGLAEALGSVAPALADRVSRFHTYQVGILFEHLRERRQPVALPEPLRQRCGWTL